MEPDGRYQAGAAVVMTYQIVMVEWIDAEHEAEWSSVRDEVEHVMSPTYSVGWLVHEDANRLVLAGCVRLDQDDVSNKQYIPIGMIIRRTTLWHPDTNLSWREMWDRRFDKPELVEPK